MIRLVNEDWQRAELLGVGKKNYVKFDFQFNETSLTSHLMAVQYENKIDQISETYNSTPTIGFDDLAHISEIKYNDAEVLEYKAMDPFAVHLYPPIKTAEVYRTGAEEEYPARGRIGPVGDFRSNPLDSVIYAKIPDKLLQPPALAPYKILYPRENLRRFEELNSVTEVDPEYMLRWEPADYFSILRPSIQTKEQMDGFKQELISATPGFDSLHYLSRWQIEKTRYWNHNVNIPADIFDEHRIEQHCPDIIYNIEKDDVKSDEESDDDNDDEFKLMVEVADGSRPPKRSSTSRSSTPSSRRRPRRQRQTSETKKRC